MKHEPGFGLHNLAYVERVFAAYRRDPESVPAAWRDRFQDVTDSTAPATVRLAPSFPPTSLFHPARATNGTVSDGSRFQAAISSGRLDQLIENYRACGHLMAAINPLFPPTDPPVELSADYSAFTEGELERLTVCPTLPYDQPLTVREILRRLNETYCRSIGAQVAHIESPAQRHWLQRRMESSLNRLTLAPAEQRRIFERLTDAAVFEEFLRRHFVGAKTFSLEGSEMLLPLLDLAVAHAARRGVRDIVLGMAHRGRLTILVHLLGKDPREIFREMADEPIPGGRSGDVRYHLGQSGEQITPDGHRVHLSLCYNPSHLEFVNPVALGRVRARQDRFGDEDRRKVCGLLIHGDASFAGQGIVQETLNFSRLAGYAVGGVLHVVVNNQIGFTTPPPDARATRYATDAARVLPAPIFHVNGEDPEAVAQVVRLAVDFRTEFASDAFIDLCGYRRWGHNETDDPSFTQPLLYRAIATHPPVRQKYETALVQAGLLTEKEASEAARVRRDQLEKQLEASATSPHPKPVRPTWRGYAGGPEPEPSTATSAEAGDNRSQPRGSVSARLITKAPRASESDGESAESLPDKDWAEPSTSVAAEKLRRLLRRLTELPHGFHLHPKLERLWNARREMADGSRAVDWATAEALALVSLAAEGVRIRLTGQDTARGTFSQRHAVVHDQEGGGAYRPWQHAAPEQAPVEVCNSPLNETGCLGFEYGYSLDCPEGLVLWEAQFGDFINAAEVIVDQFIASGEDKWCRLSGLVLLLPHGFEGMGAEHSSARLERFLTLAAKDNFQIVQPTTPAQYFHCLRRQALWRWRKPLVVFTPKSLIRHPKVVSSLEELTTGSFQRVLVHSSTRPDVARVLLSSGKVYFDLLDHQEKHKRDDVALVRLEQLYPLREPSLAEALSRFPGATEVCWVQEEPENMGAWRDLRARFGESIGGQWPWRLVSRPPSASPATASHAVHQQEQADLIQRAFDPPPPAPPPS